MVNSESGEVDYLTFENGINMEILDFKVNDETNITNEVATKLKYMKKPIDFFSNTPNRREN